MIGDIANWVAIQRMRRPDLLANATQNALSGYLSICGAVPFEDLQQMTNPEISTVSGQTTYDLSSYNMLGIMSIRLTIATNQVYRLKRTSTRQLDVFQATQSRPFLYARFAKGIEVAPVPDSGTYTMRIRFWSRPPLDFSDPGGYGANTVLATPIEWDELFKYEALYRTYLDIEEYEKASYLIAPSAMPKQATPRKVLSSEVGILPRLWNELMKRYNQREAVDEDFSVNPANRYYTSIRG